MYDIFKPVKRYKIWGISTSDVEIKDLIKAWIAISLAFGVVLGGVRIIGGLDILFTTKFLQSFLLAGLTVGIGFLFHELGHKVVAQKYNCWAEFRAFNQMLVFAVILAFLAGFVFAAPGAVMISRGHVNVRKNGKISLAGPLVNLVLCVVFMGILLLVVRNVFVFRELLGTNIRQVISSLPLMYSIPIIGVKINAWLALFNMIPFWNFDGVKILRWNKGAYFMVIGVALLFLFL